MHEMAQRLLRNANKVHGKSYSRYSLHNWAPQQCMLLRKFSLLLPSMLCSGAARMCKLLSLFLTSAKKEPTIQNGLQGWPGVQIAVSPLHQALTHTKGI